MSSNLPPGVTTSMLPGNRHEDAEYERLANDLYEVVPEGVSDELFDLLVEFVDERVQRAYSAGYRDAVADTALSPAQTEETR